MKYSKNFLILVTFLVGLQANAQSQSDKKLEAFFNPKSKNIFISAHRGDWRNAPENSIQSLKNSITMGIDIVEMDLKRSKDGQLIVMHDATLDRTSTGSGRPEDYTWEELQTLYLKSGSGVKTAHKIPKFDEFLDVAKGKIIICVDKGIDYFDQAMDLINAKEMQYQVIYLIPHMSLDSLKRRNLKNYTDEIALNVVADPTRADIYDMIKSYEGRKKTIIHPTFASDTLTFVKWMPSISHFGLKLWLNALWPNHNGGHDDDKAVEENKPDQTWGWLANHGANVIQTDRPKELLLYLQRKKLHYK